MPSSYQHYRKTHLRELNSPFTEAEIAQAIQTLPSGKSPGPDGYIKTFQQVLLPYICSTFNQAMIEGSVPSEILQTTIVTLPKPGKPSDTPANFRPISLLNTDIKLYAKVLGKRLLLILPELISTDQVGFVKRRQAPDGCILNFWSQTEQSKDPMLFLSLDA